jgi:hypothetical protein
LEPPVDRPRELHQRVVHIDDLIEAGAKQILLTALPPFSWLHRILRPARGGAQNHGLRFDGIPDPILQEKRPAHRESRQNQQPEFGEFPCPIRPFGIFQTT